MNEDVLTPKFLTREMAEVAVEIAVETVFGLEVMKPKRDQVHVVVLVPGMTDEQPDGRPRGDYQIRPVTLYEYSRGHQEDYALPFDEIAPCKALQLWQDRNDGRTDIIPHLLFAGDAPYWGGVKRQGIVVACSGIQPWLDKLIASMVADLLIAMAHDAWVNSSDKAEEVLLLT